MRGSPRRHYQYSRWGIVYPSLPSRITYGRQFYDLIWSLALGNASIEHGLKVAGSCPLAR